MTVAATRNLVLSALDPTAAGPSSDTGERPISSIVTELSVDGRPLPDQVAFAAVLDRLRSRGLIERTIDDSCGVPVLSLTPAGRERASQERRSLEETEIEVVTDEGRRTMALGAAATRFDRSMAAIAAACTEDGVYDVRERDLVVGRDAERRVWRAIVDRVTATRNGEAVFCTGPSGVGKSTLVEQLTADASTFDVTVARTRCLGSAGAPYQPLRSLLTDLGASPETVATWRRTDGYAWRAPRQRRVLFAEVTDALVPDGDEAVRVLVFEDLHRADRGTLAYLSGLLAELHTLSLIVLGTYRPGLLPTETPVAPGAIPEETPVTRFGLEDFDADDVAAVLRRRLGCEQPAPALVDLVARRTGGSPWALDVLVERIHRNETIDGTSVDEDTIKAVLDDRAACDPEAVLAAPFTALDGPTRDLLRWLAIGRAVPIETLEALPSVPTAGLDLTVDVLVACGHLFREGEVVGLQTEARREAVVARLPAEEREARHRLLADLMAMGTHAPRFGRSPVAGLEPERLGVVDGVSGAVHVGSRSIVGLGSGGATSQTDLPADRPDEVLGHAALIADHYDQAGAKEHAITWYREAAETALASGAYEDALEYEFQALERSRTCGLRAVTADIAARLARTYAVAGDGETADRYLAHARDRVDEDDHSRRQRLARLASTLSLARGDVETAHEELDAGLDLADDPSLERARLLATRARVHWHDGERTAAVETTEEAAALVTECDDSVTKARIDRQLGWYAMQEGALREAESHYREAVATTRAVGCDGLLATALREQALLAHRRGPLEEAAAIAREAFERAAVAGDRETAATARLTAARIALDSGDPGAATTHCRRARTTARALGDRRLEGQLLEVLAGVARHRGSYDRSEELATEALDLATATGDRAGLARARTQIGAIAQARGNLDAAMGHYQSALDVATATRNGPTAHVRIHLAHATVLAGEPTTARTHCTAALDTLAAMGQRLSVATAWTAMARVAHAQSALETAAERARTALETARQVGERATVADAHLVLGVVGLDGDGDPASTRTHLEAALETYETVGATGRAARTRYHLGRLAASTGDADAATAQWRAACETFEAIGAVGDAVTTLEALVTHYRTVEPKTGERWCRHALTLLTADEIDGFEDERDWFANQRQSLEAASPEE